MEDSGTMEKWIPVMGYNIINPVTKGRISPFHPLYNRNNQVFFELLTWKMVV